MCTHSERPNAIARQHRKHEQKCNGRACQLDMVRQSRDSGVQSPATPMSIEALYPKRPLGLTRLPVEGDVNLNLSIDSTAEASVGNIVCDDLHAVTARQGCSKA